MFNKTLNRVRIQEAIMAGRQTAGMTGRRFTLILAVAIFGLASGASLLVNSAWAKPHAVQSSPIAIASIVPSPDYQKKLADDYGERELRELSDALTRAVQLELAKQSRSDVSLKLIIHDARPNRPTFNQLGISPYRDFSRSFGIGGADVEALIYDEKGQLVQHFRNEWYEHNIEFEFRGTDPWYDARRSFYFFADALRRELQKDSAGRPSKLIPISE